jgi:curved DNA-binding protein
MPGAGFGGAGGSGTPGGPQYQYRTVTPEELNDLFGEQSPFSDFFEQFFGSSFGGAGSSGFPGMSSMGGATTGRARQRPTIGQDIESQIEVTLPEAYTGVSRVFELTDVDGSSKRIEVKIPAGVDEGSRIRISGQGAPGSAGRGHLYLVVHMVRDARFTRDGTTLHTIVDVPLTVAMLGGEAQVTTPDGRKLALRIPPETNNGKSFRLRGQGMPRLGHIDERGDLYAEVAVTLPTHLNSEQRKLFEAFAKSIGYESNG